jgi:hypothetical protein
MAVHFYLPGSFSYLQRNNYYSFIRMQRYYKKLPYLLCFFVAFVLGMKQLREPDVWWQLLAGRWMLEHHQVTHSDVFSYTMAGHPWINVKWLYEVLIALIEKLLGPTGVLLLQGMVNIAIVYLVVQSLRKVCKILQQPAPYFYTLVAILLFLVTVEYRMAGRPEMISHLMCALYLFIFINNPQHQWKNILLLIPLQCLWANMHEGYPVGLVMTGTLVAGTFIAYLTGKDKAALQQTIRLSLLFLAMVFIVLLNPNGIQLWKQPFEIYRQVWANKYTTELYSFTQHDYWTLQAGLYIAMLALVVWYWGCKVYNVRSNIRTSIFATPVVCAYLLLVALFAYLSLTANRNMPFGAIVLFPSIPLAIYQVVHIFRWSDNALYKRLSKASPIIAAVIALALYCSIVSNVYYKVTASENRYGLHVNMLHNPTGAAAYLMEHNIQGTAFSDYFVSSYLLWSSYPQFKSYVDLRDLDVFPVSFFNDYFKMYDHPELFKDLDKKYNFNYVIVSTSQLAALQMELYWKPGYNMVYADPIAAIFLKSNEQNKPINDNPTFQKPFSWPQPVDDPAWAWALSHLLNPAVNYSDEDESHSPVYAAFFYNQVRDYPQAIKMLLPYIGNLQDDAMAHQTLAAVYTNYAAVTKDPLLKQKRLDSANTYGQYFGE